MSRGQVRPRRLWRGSSGHRQPSPEPTGERRRASRSRCRRCGLVSRPGPLHRLIRQAMTRLRTSRPISRLLRDKSIIERRFHKKRYRRYILRGEGQSARPGSALMLAFLSLTALYCAVRLTVYGLDAYRAHQASAMLRQIYYEEEPTAAPPATPSPAPLWTLAPAAADISMPTPEPTPETRLRLTGYPDNPDGHISQRFEKLRRQNEDIVGWLRIDGALEEAVVQRDNVYYLNRNYCGYHNVNGAIFLEETCDLSVRPYTLMLYGHNMKSGAMFGGLRNYESLAYYQKNPFITFDTAYEGGRYVVFSVAMISLNPRSRSYIDFSKLNSSIISCREDALTALRKVSVYAVGLDVTARDQLLLLITCASDDAERRVIAARRIREDESESALMSVIHSARKR